MTVNFDLCDSEFDTYIRIIDDSGNEVAGNDDHSRCGSRGFGWGSHVEILILAGRTYTVVVEGFATHEGDFQLDVTCTLGTLSSKHLKNKNYFVSTVAERQKDMCQKSIKKVIGSHFKFKKLYP